MASFAENIPFITVSFNENGYIAYLESVLDDFEVFIRTDIIFGGLYNPFFEHNQLEPPWEGRF